MANNVIINYSTSGLGTPAIGQDFISGLIFYSATTVPSGFSANTVQEIFSVAEAEALGITLATQVSASTYTDVMHYHIAEYFRSNPTGDLWVNISASASSASSYSEIVTLQNAANGIIRQIGIYEQIPFLSANLASIQTQINTNITNNKPLEVIYQPDFSSVSNLSTLTDLTSLNAPNVSVTIGQDGAAVGKALYGVIGKSIGCVGLTLGAVSSALVSTSIAWVQNFNMDSVEMDTLAMANGSLLTSLSDGLINAIDAKSYIFLKKFIGIFGSYFNSDLTSIVGTSDYSSIHLNRTIHKVARNVRAQVLPSIASPVYFNADGSIALYSIGFFESECNVALANMVSAGEISQFKTIINAKQNVLATKTLNIGVQIIPVGVANIINLNIGFVLSI